MEDRVLFQTIQGAINDGMRDGFESMQTDNKQNRLDLTATLIMTAVTYVGEGEFSYKEVASIAYTAAEALEAERSHRYFPATHGGINIGDANGDKK